METIEKYKGFEIVKSNRLEGWFMTRCETMCGESIREVKEDLDRMLIDRNRGKKVTVYFMGEFGMGAIKVEGKLKDMGTRKYAQYNNAPFIDMVPTRKRKTRRFMQTSHPYMIILEGVGHPDPKDGYQVVSESETVTVKQSRHLSFSTEWSTEADELLDRYIKNGGITVLGDFRGTKGFSSYSSHHTVKMAR